MARHGTENREELFADSANALQSMPAHTGAGVDCVAVPQVSLIGPPADIFGCL